VADRGVQVTPSVDEYVEPPETAHIAPLNVTTFRCVENHGTVMFGVR
jgi:hypothetical protein